MDILVRKNKEPKIQDKIAIAKNKSQVIYGNVSNNFILNWITNNNLNALKLALYVSKLDIAQPNQIKINEDITHLTLNLKEFSSFCNVSTKVLMNNHTSILNAKINRVSKDETEFRKLILNIKIKRNENIIELFIWTEIFYLLKEEEFSFTNINLENIMRLKNKHSIRMYLLLSYINQFNDIYSKSKEYTLEILNDFFGTDYKRVIDFNKKVIEPIKKDLLENDSNLKFEIEYKYKNIKKAGRTPISHIKIILINNKVIHELKSVFVKEIKEKYIDKEIIKDRGRTISINSFGLFYDLNETKITNIKNKLDEQDKIWEYIYSHQNEVLKIPNKRNK